MSDPKKKPQAEPAPSAPEAPSEATPAPLGRPSDSSEEAKLHAELLAEENKLLKEQLAALQGIGAKAKEADSTGEKRPFALVNMLGVGRRAIKPGDALSESETLGLKAGSDFEIR